VDAAQLQPGIGEPALQIRDRRRTVVVEMRPRRVDLDAVEAVRGDLEQMIPAQPLSVVEVRRDPELAFTHKPNSLCYSRDFL
jgi:hypothetical protein